MSSGYVCFPPSAKRHDPIVCIIPNPFQNDLFSSAPQPPVLFQLAKSFQQFLNAGQEPAREYPNHQNQEDPAD